MAPRIVILDIETSSLEADGGLRCDRDLEWSRLRHSLSHNPSLEARPRPPSTIGKDASGPERGRKVSPPPNIHVPGPCLRLFRDKARERAYGIRGSSVVCQGFGGR